MERLFYFESKTGSVSCSSWWQHVRSGLRVQFGRVVGARQEDPWICVRNGEKKSPRGSEMSLSPGELLWLFILSHVHTRNRTKWGTDSRRDQAEPDTHSRLCAHHLYLAFCALATGLDADRWTDLKKVLERWVGVYFVAVVSWKLHVEFDAVGGDWRAFTRVFGCATTLPLVSGSVNDEAPSHSGPSAVCVHPRDVYIW